jgi:hypothetical protein
LTQAVYALYGLTEEEIKTVEGERMGKYDKLFSDILSGRKFFGKTLSS